MNRDREGELTRGREIEVKLLHLGQQWAALIQNESSNREHVRRLVGPAQKAGTKVRHTARLTGLSTQTSHMWMQDLMRPIPDIHLALVGPPPTTLEQSVLRTIGEEPLSHEWQAAEALTRIPAGWRAGTRQEIGAPLERLVRWHMIWDGERGYRVASSDEVAR